MVGLLEWLDRGGEYLPPASLADRYVNGGVIGRQSLDEPVLSAPRASVVPAGRDPITGRPIDPRREAFLRDQARQAISHALGFAGSTSLPGAAVYAKPAVGARGQPLLFDAPWSNYKVDPALAARLDAGMKIERPASLYEAERVFNPNNISKDGFILGLLGDRSNIGNLTHWRGRELAKPQVLDGGRGYMQNKETGAWASDINVIRRLSNKVKSADGRPVIGSYMPMSGTATDFADMTRNMVGLDFYPAAIRAKDAKEFDAAFRAYADWKKQSADFPGIKSSELPEWLDKAGNRRAALYGFMDKAKWRDLGFPNVTEARYAISDPATRDLLGGRKETGWQSYGGQSLALMDPAGTMRPTSSLASPHGTYKWDLGGQYIGGFSQPVPRSVLFPDWYKSRRAAGKKPAEDEYMFKMDNPLQPTNQQWLDGLMDWMRANP